MKLTIKTLQQSTFKVDIEPEKTVKDLKDKIEKDHGTDFPCAAQKLIYSGKILADESKLAEYNIDEKKFVVLMITRPPPAQKPPPVVEKQTTTSTSTKSSTTTKKDDSSTSSSSSSTTTIGKKEDKTSNKSSASSATTAPPSTTATATTTTTTSGVTSTLATGGQNRSTGTGTTSSSVSNEQALSMSESQQMASRLASLMAEPQFRQIQDLIQQSPHLLSSTIEALAGTDPEMYSFISDNPDVFVSALNHPPLAGNRTHPSRGTPGNGGQQQQQQRGEQRSSQSAASPVRNPASRQQSGTDQTFHHNVTEQDREAIERLKELGFPELMVYQAYMACDRDEQLAANLLFQMDQ